MADNPMGEPQVAALIGRWAAYAPYGGFASMSAQSQAVANGWWRLVFTFTTLTDATLTAYLLPALDLAASSPVYLGTTGRGIYAWGTQLEAGSFSTPYIPTTTAAATRGAPSMYINAPGLLVPPYTIQAWANLSATGGILVVASDGTTANRVQLERNSGNGATMQVNGGTGGSGPTVPGKGGARLLKMAGRVRATEYALSVDGAAPLISSGVTPPSGLSQIRFGANPGGVGILNGTIQRFQIINRDVTDAELQALTA